MSETHRLNNMFSELYAWRDSFPTTTGSSRGTNSPLRPYWASRDSKQAHLNHRTSLAAYFLATSQPMNYLAHVLLFSKLPAMLKSWPSSRWRYVSMQLKASHWDIRNSRSVSIPSVTPHLPRITPDRTEVNFYIADSSTSKAPPSQAIPK